MKTSIVFAGALMGASACAEVAREPAEPASQERSVPAIESQYTSLENCALVEQNLEEGGYSLRRCAGIGADLMLIESDGRQSISVALDSAAPVPLRFPEFAGNGGFSTVGPRAEWRGNTLIVRYNVAENPAPEINKSYLIVARWTPDPCVLAVVSPHSQQNETARARADAGGACIVPGATSQSRDKGSPVLALDPKGLRTFVHPSGSARPIP